MPLALPAEYRSKAAFRRPPKPGRREICVGPTQTGKTRVKNAVKNLLTPEDLP